MMTLFGDSRTKGAVSNLGIVNVSYCSWWEGGKESYLFDNIYQVPGICLAKLFIQYRRFSGEQARLSPFPQMACSPGQETLTQWVERQVRIVPL